MIQDVEQKSFQSLESLSDYLNKNLSKRFSSDTIQRIREQLHASKNEDGSANAMLVDCKLSRMEIRIDEIKKGEYKARL